MRRVVRLTPRWVADRLQDLYLRLPALPIADPRFADDPAAAGLFFRARHQHVLLRSQEARAGYEEFLRRYPAHPATDHVLYYLGMLQLSQLRDAESAIVTFGQLLERFPRTVWEEEATYLLARPTRRRTTARWRPISIGAPPRRKVAVARTRRASFAAWPAGDRAAVKTPGEQRTGVLPSAALRGGVVEFWLRLRA